MDYAPTPLILSVMETPDPEAARMKLRGPPWTPVVVTTAVFVAVGPLVGLVFFLGPAALLVSIMFAGLPIIFAYVIGLPAAAVAGLAAGLAARSGRLWIFGLTAIVVGGLSPLILPGMSGQPGTTLLKLVWTGAAAAAVCALLTFHIAGLRLLIPARLLSLTRAWSASSVLLVVLGALCTILLFQFGVLLVDELVN